MRLAVERLVPGGCPPSIEFCGYEQEKEKGKRGGPARDFHYNYHQSLKTVNIEGWYPFAPEKTLAEVEEMISVSASRRICCDSGGRGAHTPHPFALAKLHQFRDAPTIQREQRKPLPVRRETGRSMGVRLSRQRFVSFHSCPTSTRTDLLGGGDGWRGMNSSVRETPPGLGN